MEIEKLWPWMATVAMLIVAIFWERYQRRKEDLRRAKEKEDGSLTNLKVSQGTLQMALDTNEQLNRRMGEQDDKIDRQNERLDICELASRVSRRQIEMLSDQVVGRGGMPVSYEEAAQSIGITLAVFEESYQDLRHELTQAFDESELMILARDIGFNPGEIRGGTLTERAAELIDKATREKRTKQLRDEVLKARPAFPRKAFASLKL